MGDPLQAPEPLHGVILTSDPQPPTLSGPKIDHDNMRMNIPETRQAHRILSPSVTLLLSLYLDVLHFLSNLAFLQISKGAPVILKIYLPQLERTKPLFLMFHILKVV